MIAVRQCLEDVFVKGADVQVRICQVWTLHFDPMVQVEG